MIAVGKMSIQLNHTSVPARDPLVSAIFLTGILALASPVRFGPFRAVALGEGGP